MVSHLIQIRSSISHLPSSIFHLPSSIFHLPSYIFLTNPTPSCVTKVRMKQTKETSVVVSPSPRLSPPIPVALRQLSGVWPLPRLQRGGVSEPHARPDRGGQASSQGGHRSHSLHCRVRRCHFAILPFCHSAFRERLCRESLPARKILEGGEVTLGNTPLSTPCSSLYSLLDTRGINNKA